MDFGYVRVSTKEQNPARQVKILMELGIEERNIYVEKKSGHHFNRETYDMLVNHIMRPGDRLTVTELKRFGRNYREIYQEWHHITKELQMDIRVADMKILDTSMNKGPDRAGHYGCCAGITVLCGGGGTGRNDMNCNARELRWQRQREGIWADPRWSSRRIGRTVMTDGRKALFRQEKRWRLWD